MSTSSATPCYPFATRRSARPFVRLLPPEGWARVVSGFIAGGAGRRLASDAELLTSEIVSNSVRHAGLDTSDLIGIDVDLTHEHIRVSVSDGGPGFEIEPPRPLDPGGWGLVLVDRISSRWGIVRHGPTIVWFELDR